MSGGAPSASGDAAFASFRRHAEEVAGASSPNRRPRPVPPDVRIRMLAALFPTLAGLDSVYASTWDPEAFDREAGRCLSSGGLHAARFVLSVWNALATWDVGPFELAKAIGVWDAAHLEAFKRWAVNPWLA